MYAASVVGVEKGVVAIQLVLMEYRKGSMLYSNNCWSIEMGGCYVARAVGV